MRSGSDLAGQTGKRKDRAFRVGGSRCRLALGRGAATLAQPTLFKSQKGFKALQILDRDDDFLFFM